MSFQEVHLSFVLTDLRSALTYCDGARHWTGSDAPARVTWVVHFSVAMVKTPGPRQPVKGRVYLGL